MEKHGLVFLLSLALSCHGFGQNDLNSDDLELEQRVLEANIPTKTSLQSVSKLELSQLTSIADTEASQSRNCQDVKKIIFSEKYVLTYDEQGQPCRIYDLSFPNFKAGLRALSYFKLPLRKLASKDYLDALDNNWESWNQKQEFYRNNFSPRTEANQSFLAQLTFKNNIDYVFGSKVWPGDTGIPKQFTLNDLNFSPTQVSQKTKQQIESLLLSLKASGENSPWIQILASLTQQPELFFKAFQFKWNDAQKVFDVLLDADFFPISGPVVLVNFQAQHKIMIEKLFRQALGEILSQSTRLIPHKLISAIVQVAIDDTFEQIEFLYSYQLNRLEMALKNIDSSKVADDDKNILTSRALNIVFGQKTDLLQNYLMSVAQKQEFDWQAIEKLGAKTAYSIEKQRQVTLDKVHSRLVLERKCSTSIFDDYFAVCSINGQQDGVYSLISEQSFAIKNLGAPLIYRFKRPYEVAAVRGGTWILSAALRIFGLPISRMVTGKLNSILKDFFQAGLLDEAFLQTKLVSNQSALASIQSGSVLNWLYIQNLNPFLPKSPGSERDLIEVNKSILGLNQEQQ